MSYILRCLLSLLIITVPLLGGTALKKLKTFHFSDEISLQGDRRWKQIPGESFLVTRSGASVRLQIDQNPLPLADYVANTLKGLQKDQSRYTLLKQTPVTVDHLKGVSLTGTLPYRRITLQIKTMILHRRGEKYLFTFGFRNDQIKELSPVIDAMIKTIKFKDSFIVKKIPESFPYIITIPEGFSYKKGQLIDQKGNFFYLSQERSSVPVDQYITVFKEKLPEIFPEYEYIKEKSGYLAGMKYHRIQGQFTKNKILFQIIHTLYLKGENKYLLTVVTFKGTSNKRDPVNGIWKSFKGIRVQSKE